MGNFTGVHVGLSTALGFSAGVLATTFRGMVFSWARGKHQRGDNSFAPIQECGSGPSSSAAKADFCDRPHQEWKPGENQSPPFDASRIVSIDPASCAPGTLYPLVISSVVPRPIAFISSVSENGVGNLAPYSYFNVLSHDPPVLAIGHCRSKGHPKDSLTNILQTKELVVGIVSEWMVESANHTCGAFDPNVNEMDLTGLSPIQSIKVSPPRIQECAINMECRLRETFDLTGRDGEITCTILLADVVMFHIAEAVASQSPNSKKLIVDPVKLQPISRLGGNIFGRVSSMFEIPRPDKDGKYPWDAHFAESERDLLIKTSEPGKSQS